MTTNRMPVAGSGTTTIAFGISAAVSGPFQTRSRLMEPDELNSLSPKPGLSTKNRSVRDTSVLASVPNADEKIGVVEPLRNASSMPEVFRVRMKSTGVFAAIVPAVGLVPSS